MRWRLLFALIGLSITGVTSFAQRPPGAEGLDAARSGPGDAESRSAQIEDAGFFSSSGSGVVRFQLIQGRLCLDAPRHRKGSQNAQQGDVYESITVTAQRGLPSLHYVYQSPDQHLTLNVTDATSVRIESWLPQSSRRSIIHQTTQGPIDWELRDEDAQQNEQRQVLAAATLLHLRQQNSADFDNHFGRLVTQILRGTSLQDLCRKTHDQMLAVAAMRMTQEPLSFTCDDVDGCIERFRSPKRHVRTESERQLLAWGTPVISMLDCLSTKDLDAEQLQRIQRVRNKLRRPIQDTPSTLAHLLVNDLSYWSLISSSLTDADRALAQQHLGRIGFQLSDDTSVRIATK